MASHLEHGHFDKPISSLSSEELFHSQNTSFPEGAWIERRTPKVTKNFIKKQRSDSDLTRSLFPKIVKLSSSNGHNLGKIL